MSSISDEEAVITIKVKLVSETEGLEGAEDVDHNPFLSGVDPELQEFIDQEVKATVDEQIADSLEAAGVDLEAVERMTEALDEMGITGLKNMTNFAKSPESFSENMFMNFLGKAGPYGALATALIGLIIGSPVLFQAVVEQLGVKGGPLNQDWRLSQEGQENQLYDRRTLYRRIVGDDPIITFSTLGFVTPSDPDFAGNSLVSAGTSRSGRVDLQNSSFGYIHGV